MKKFYKFTTVEVVFGIKKGNYCIYLIVLENKKVFLFSKLLSYAWVKLRHKLKTKS